MQQNQRPPTPTPTTGHRRASERRPASTAVFFLEFAAAQTLMTLPSCGSKASTKAPQMPPHQPPAPLSPLLLGVLLLFQALPLCHRLGLVVEEERRP